jgi:hypothetical protein
MSEQLQKMVEGLDLASLIEEIAKGTGYWAAVQDGVLSKMKLEKIKGTGWEGYENIPELIKKIQAHIYSIQKDARLNYQETYDMERVTTGLLHLSRLTDRQMDLIEKLSRGMKEKY